MISSLEKPRRRRALPDVTLPSPPVSRANSTWLAPLVHVGSWLNEIREALAHIDPEQRSRQQTGRTVSNVAIHSLHF